MFESDSNLRSGPVISTISYFLAECLVILVRIELNENQFNKFAAILASNFIIIDTLFIIGMAAEKRAREEKALKTLTSVWRFNHYNNKSISNDENDEFKATMNNYIKEYFSIENERRLEKEFAQNYFKRKAADYLEGLDKGIGEEINLVEKHFDLATNKFKDALETKASKGLIIE